MLFVGVKMIVSRLVGDDKVVAQSGVLSRWWGREKLGENGIKTHGLSTQKRNSPWVNGCVKCDGLFSMVLEA